MPRILKFCINVGCGKLYCVTENQPSPAYHSFICPFFFLSNQIICHRFLSSYESLSLQILCTLETGQGYCGKGYNFSSQLIWKI